MEQFLFLSVSHSLRNSFGLGKIFLFLFLLAILQLMFVPIVIFLHGYSFLLSMGAENNLLTAIPQVFSWYCGTLNNVSDILAYPYVSFSSLSL